MSMPHYAPQEHGQAYPGPTDYEPVYPAGDPVFRPVDQPTGTPPPAVDDGGIADFTIDRPRPRFRIGDDLFEGKMEVPTLSLMTFAAQQKDDSTQEESIEMTMRLLRLMLKKESADRFIDRLGSEDNPIGVETFQKIVPWLMEQYGMRPTQPSPDSSAGSPSQDDGPRSTENSPVVE